MEKLREMAKELKLGQSQPKPSSEWKRSETVQTLMSPRDMISKKTPSKIQMTE